MQTCRGRVAARGLCLSPKGRVHDKRGEGCVLQQGSGALCGADNGAVRQEGGGGGVRRQHPREPVSQATITEHEGAE